MKPIYLVSVSGRKIGSLFDMDFNASSMTYSGCLSLTELPNELHQLLVELEEVVDGQSFALVDEIQRKIDDFGTCVIFDNGKMGPIRDLYLSSDRGVSFRLAAGSDSNESSGASPASR
jgi:hypothetical protein